MKAPLTLHAEKLEFGGITSVYAIPWSLFHVITYAECTLHTFQILAGSHRCTFGISSASRSFFTSPPQAFSPSHAIIFTPTMTGLPTIS